MPVNTDVANEVWARYQWLRDNGHLSYTRKAKKCEDFFAGVQWDPADLALLKAARRPALTINKIISTISNVLGEQIYNRTDIAFRPRNEGATTEVADALTKVFMQIGDNNLLAWTRSDVFCDGIITSRGFFDVRLDFTDSLRGEVKITQPNPKNVLIATDADEYDPDTWPDVITTKWMSADQIELMYSKADADMLRGRTDTYSPYGSDAIDSDADRFGGRDARQYGTDSYQNDSAKTIRVIERQYRKLDKVEHFVDIITGDMRMVPESWDEQQRQAYLDNNPNVAITKKMIQRIRWVVVADNVVLHDDWSPYRHFTIVPYFPYFRRGTTVGLVENLIDPQELLNKVSSQELHIVNTSANSGWKVKRGALQNMTPAELENRGAQTGLVLELDDINNVDKINPNQTPSGLDRISFKAEEHIKGISGISDYMLGSAREDVSAKSVNANKQSGQANLAKVMDNMNRTDTILARNILDLVQEYYTEERLVFITTDKLQNTTETLTVNGRTPEGTIANDLTIGEYAIIVTNQPERDNFEDTQFDQLVRLRTEVGVQVPDKFVLQASRAKDKADIIKAMEGDQDSEEAKAEAQMKMREREATVAQLEAEVESTRADVEAKKANAQKALAVAGEVTAKTGAEDNEANEAMIKLEAEQKLARQKLEGEQQLARDKMEAEIELKREAAAADIDIKRETAKNDADLKRATEIHNAAQQQAKPQAPEGASNAT